VTLPDSVIRPAEFAFFSAQYLNLRGGLHGVRLLEFGVQNLGDLGAQVFQMRAGFANVALCRSSRAT